MLLPTLTMAAILNAQPVPQVFSAAGTSADSIRSAVDAFRKVLGPANPAGPAQDPEGRREINWDGVSDAVSAPNSFPRDFFNKNSARGAVFAAPGAGWAGFSVSARDGVAPVRFDNFNPSYSGLFQTFSPQRLFVSTGTHVYDARFLCPWHADPRHGEGFGAVFTNVGLDFSSSIEYFTPEGISLGKST